MCAAVLVHVALTVVEAIIALVPCAEHASEERVVGVERVAVGPVCFVAANVVGNNNFLANSELEFCLYFPSNIENDPCTDRWLDGNRTIDLND